MLVLGIAALGAVLIWFATLNGPGLLMDSVNYLRACRALLDGQSLFAIGTHFPPGYSLLWALATVLTGDEMLAARLLASLSYAAMLAGFGFSLRLLPTSREAWSWLLILYLVCVPTMVSLHWSALSEGPFLACFCWSIYAVLRLGYKHDAGTGLWVLLFLCLASMCLLRYAGAPLAGALLLALFFLRYRQNWRVLPGLAVFGALTLLPLLGWLLVSVAANDADSARQFVVHPPGLVHVRQLGTTLSGWMGGLPGVIAAILLLALTGALLWNRQSRKRPQVQFSLIVVASYLGFLLLSVTFFDAYISFDHRILAPMLPVLLILASAVPATRWETPALGVIALLLVLNLLPYRAALVGSIARGEGFSNLAVRNAAVFRVTSKLAADRPIYTNAGEFYYLFYHRDVESLPAIFDPITRELNPAVGAEWDAMLENVAARNGLIVWSEHAAFRDYYPTVDHLLEVGGLVVLDKLDGGTILVAAPKSPRESSGQRPDEG